MLVGVVGKPNVGKSTFFRAATLAQAATGNYPFVTIKPNRATAFVKVRCVSEFFHTKSQPREGYYVNGFRFVPIDLMDVAGLVPGAHEGLGMGNAFLDDLRQADVLIHVIDISGSTNEKGEAIETGTYDPANDITFLETELDMWYVGILSKGWEKFARTVQQTHTNIIKALAKQLSGLGVTEDLMKHVLEKELQFSLEKPAEWTSEQLMQLATVLRKKTKPMLIAANRIDMPNAQANLDRLKKMFPDYTIIGCSSEVELALKEAAKKELIEYVPGDSTFTIKQQLDPRQVTALDFMKKNVLEKYGSSGVQQILDYAVFDLLHYIPIYPGGVNKLSDSQGRVLPDCFLLKSGSTVLDFAYRLHTDFGDKFIRAIDVKTKKSVGKEHLLSHSDVIEIVADK